jgi:hypothetical protein
VAVAVAVATVVAAAKIAISQFGRVGCRTGLGRTDSDRAAGFQTCMAWPSANAGGEQGRQDFGRILSGVPFNRPEGLLEGLSSDREALCGVGSCEGLPVKLGYRILAIRQIHAQGLFPVAGQPVASKPFFDIRTFRRKVRSLYR